VPSFALGAVPGVLNWSRRDMVNLAITTWGEFGTALAGVRLQVRGEEHLWSHRPAVFVFNHQSAIDMLLLCKLLRRDFVGVAKHGLVIRPATIEVVVHPPVPTDGWQAETLDRQIADVRALFVRALEG